MLQKWIYAWLQVDYWLGPIGREWCKAENLFEFYEVLKFLTHNWQNEWINTVL